LITVHGEDIGAGLVHVLLEFGRKRHQFSVSSRNWDLPVCDGARDSVPVGVVGADRWRSIIRRLALGGNFLPLLYARGTALNSSLRYGEQVSDKIGLQHTSHRPCSCMTIGKFAKAKHCLARFTQTADGQMAHCKTKVTRTVFAGAIGSADLAAEICH